MARVGLVTPLRDGMNLVAQEYVAAQDPDDPGVLILSRFVGAAINFRRSLLVNPYDAESVATALAQALSMPLKERRARHEALYAKVCEYDVNRWQQEFLAALRGGRREDERFQSNPSNSELTNLETSGARLAPIDQAGLSARRRRATRRAVIKREA
jgi:trehalose 6-phosphate synthase